MRIWDPTTGTTRHILTGHTSTVTALVVAADGSWLASAGDGREVRVWAPATGTTRHILTGHTSTVVALAVTAERSWLASASDGGEIRLWDPTTAAPLTALRAADRLSHLVSASTTIAAAGERGPYFLALRPATQFGEAP